MIFMSMVKLLLGNGEVVMLTGVLILLVLLVAGFGINNLNMIHMKMTNTPAANGIYSISVDGDFVIAPIYQPVPDAAKNIDNTIVNIAILRSLFFFSSSNLNASGNEIPIMANQITKSSIAATSIMTILTCVHARMLWLYKHFKEKCVNERLLRLVSRYLYLGSRLRRRLQIRLRRWL